MISKTWRIELLGTLRAVQGSCEITRFESRQTGLLLALLALHKPPPQPREVLIERLWPDVAPETGRNRLKQALSWLRRQMDREELPLFLATRTHIGLQPTAFVTDVELFEQALHHAQQASRAEERSRSLLEAIETYHGELLPGYYNDWVLNEQARLAALHVEALECLTALLEQQGDSLNTLEIAYRLMALDPFAEAPYRTLIRLHLAAGRPEEALRLYATLERLLSAEMGTVPSQAMRQLVAQITPSPSGETALRAAQRRPQSSGLLQRAAQRLPLPPSRFFGREAELQQLQALFTHEADSLPLAPRLVTLTGLGGSGKTRLALEIGRRLFTTLHEAVWFVPLESLTEANRIPDAIAAALHLPPLPQEPPLEQMVEFLNRSEDAPPLLILDNFEHLTEAGSEVVRRVLERIPLLRILITSRQPLGLRGEQEFPLAPLPCTPDALLLERLLQCPGLRFLVDRIQAVRPDFQITVQNAADLIALSARLEGLPLAIELAAAWAQTLSPAEMLARLENPFTILVARTRDLPDRHRSLHTALEGSYHHLSPPLQRCFARLAVFRGSWTLDAFTHIACPENPDAGLSLLTALREHSLVLTVEHAGEIRFRLLETVREYAAELETAEEQHQTAQRHAHYFTQLAQAVMEAIYTTSGLTWLNRFPAEDANFTAALRWTLAHEPVTALTLCGRMTALWFRLGRFVEGYGWLEQALRQAPPDTPLQSLALAQYGAGMMIWNLENAPEAVRLLKESIALWQQQDCLQDLARALHILAIIRHEQNQHEEALQLYEQALAIRREIGDMAGVGGSCCMLGRLFHVPHLSRYSPETGQRLFQEGLALARQRGDTWQEAWLLHFMAAAALQTGEVEKCLALSEQALEHFHFWGDKRGIFATLTPLLAIHFQRDDTDQMERTAQEALRAAWEIRRRGAIGHFLPYCTLVAYRRQQWERGAKLQGFLSKEAEPSLVVIEQSAARAALGEAHYQRLWEEGRLLSPEQAVNLALMG